MHRETFTVPPITLEERQRLEDDFIERLRARWAQGADAYGDRSYGQASGDLITELQEELIDVAGWALPLFHRLEKLRQTADRLERLAALEVAVRRAVDDRGVAPLTSHEDMVIAVRRVQAAIRELDEVAT